MVSGMLGLTDAPLQNIDDESLGLRDYVNALKTFISTCQTPMTIAIQGDWGSGKTSMMNVVRSGLDHQRIATRWFNTWQFAQFSMQDEIAISLLSGFLDELGDDAQKARSAVKNLTRMAMKGIGGISKAALEITTGGGGDLVKDAIDKLAEGSANSARQLQNLKGEINRSVDSLLAKEKKDRMIVFIDDLDRLVPERAVEILEVIKLFLDIDKCVFVLAVDYNVVAKGLQQKFGVGVDDLKGKSFFDKIIQLPFSLPVAQYDIRKYMRTLCVDPVRFSEDNLDRLVSLAENSIGTNPRSLKRLFNALQLLHIVANNKAMLIEDAVATKEERQRILFAVLCLQLAFEPFYCWLLKQQQMNTELFDTLRVVERLQASPDILSAVLKSLNPGMEADEALVRFASFMGAFKDALQLDSDTSDENAENLSSDEIDILRGFLTLSSLTSALNAATTTFGGKFRHESKITAFLDANLVPRYGQALAQMNTQLKTEFTERTATIGFRFELAAFVFDLWVAWRDDRGLSAALWEVAGCDKPMVRQWFISSLQSALPQMKFKHLRSLDYAILEEHPFISGQAIDEARTLKEFEALQERILSAVTQPLLALYQEKQPLVSQLTHWLDQLVNRLQETYPTADGWKVECEFQCFKKYGMVQVSRAEWAPHFSICLEAGNTQLRGLYVGIRRKTWRGNFGEYSEVVRKYCQDQLFQDYPKPNSHFSSDWWIYGNYPAPYQTPLEGDFISDGSCLSAKSDEIMNGLVDRMGRFKNSQDMLDQLAKYASAAS